LPEIKVAAKPANTKTSTAASSTNLVPFQLFKKQTLAMFAANKAVSKASELPLLDKATLEAAEVPLPDTADNKDDGDLSEGEEMPEGDTSVTEAIDYQPLVEQPTAKELTQVELDNAKTIAIWWKRCRRRRRRQAPKKDFSPAFKAALAIAARVPKTAPRRLDYMVMILVSYEEFEVALDLLVKETEVCKKKASGPGNLKHI
jgi:hypothetical protein